MKYFSFLFMLLLLFACDNAKEEQAKPKKEPPPPTEKKPDIPTHIQKSFQEKFPEAKDVIWERVDEIFEAEFTLNGEHIEAEFVMNGKLLMTEKKISKDSLPANILEIIKTEYADYTLESVELVESELMGQVYELEFEKDGKEYEVFFDMSGKMIDSETESEGEEATDEHDDLNRIILGL